MQLPGVVVESERTAADAEQDWPAIRSTLEAAMHNLAKMRTEEGGAMAADLRSNSQLIGVELREILLDRR